MKIASKFISGISWSFSEQLSVQLIHFVVTVFLARLLLPEEFGLIGMISILIAIGKTLADSGLTSSLIRTQHADEEDYSSVFVLNVVGGAAVYAVIYFAAPYIADFFNQQVLISIIRIYCLTFIIRSLSAVQFARLTKAMDFKTQLMVQLPSVVGGGMLGVYLAYQGYGVWSLVWMNILQSVLSTVQVFVYTGWLPKLAVNASKLRSHFSFGYKLMLSGVIDTLYQNIYNIIIGKFFSAAQLGFYTRAQSLKQLPVSNISAALNKVTYPLFAAMQDDDLKLKMVYKRVMQQVAFWITSSMVILGVIAEPLIRFMLTEKWLPAVPYFQILCVVGVMYPLHAYNLNILKVKGRSDLFLKLEIIKKSYVTIGVFCAIPFGIYGLLYFQVIATFVSFFINTFMVGKLIDYSVKEQIQDILPIFLISSIAGFIAYVADLTLAEYLLTSDFLRIVFSSLIFFLFYLVMAHVFRLNPLTDFKKIVFKK